MRPNKYYFIFCLLYICSGVFAAEKKRITIVCQVKNQVQSTIVFSQTDGLLEKVQTDSVKNLFDAKATFQIDADEPKNIKITHDFRSFELYCEPNDSIFLIFDAVTYPYEIAFSGRGALHNTVLHQIRQDFINYSQKWLITQIYTLAGMDFRKTIDKVFGEKWDTYKAITAKNRKSLSADFQNFMRAEINYWYAASLLMYPEEHTSIVAEENVFLPDAYYDFLDEIIINDDRAFVHINYQKFLQLYAHFRKKRPDFPFGLAARQLIVQGKTDNVILFSDAACSIEKRKILHDEKLVVLDKLSYLAPVTNNVVAYRLKVQTQEAQSGWIFSNAVFEENKDNWLNQSPLFIDNIDVNYEKNIVTAKAKWDKLGVYIDPQDSKPYYPLNKDENVSLFNQNTSKNITYQEGNVAYTAPFTKTSNRQGELGWTTLSGLEVKSEKKNINEWQLKIASVSQSPYFNLDYFFYGKPLFYVFGMEIKERLEIEEKAKNKDANAFFVQNCTYKDLKNEFLRVYQLSEKKFDVTLNEVTSSEQILDQRVSYANKRTNNFELASGATDLPYEKMLAAAKRKTKSENLPVIKTEPKPSAEKDNIPLIISYPDSTEKDENFTFAKANEPQFSKARYDFNPLKLFGNAKLIEKLQLRITLLPENTGLEKPLLAENRKNKWFFKADTFMYKVNLSEPIRGIVRTKNDSFLVWFEPGQRYKIVNENGHAKLLGEGVSAFSFIQQNALNNQKIQAEVDYLQNIPSKDFISLLEKKYQERVIFLQNYNVLNKLPLNILRISIAENQYWYYNELLLLAQRKKLSEDERELYLTKVKNIKVQDERALQSAEYKRFIQNYLTYKMNEFSNVYRTREVVARELFGGKVLKYWQANNLTKRLEKGVINQDLVEDVQKYAAESSYAVLDETVKNAYTSQTMQQEGFTLPPFELRNFNNEIVNKEDAQNKVVLMYFWSAKQADFEKNMDELNAFEKTVPDVVFFKINIDNDPLLWRKAVKKYKKDKYQLFGNDTNVYAKNLSDLLLLKQDALKVVIDKQGAVAKKLDKNATNEAVKAVLKTELAKPDAPKNKSQREQLNKERRKKLKGNISRENEK